MKKNTLLAGVSMLALIVAGCNADRGDNLGMNNDTEVVVVNEDEARDVAENRADRVDNDNDPATKTP